MGEFNDLFQDFVDSISDFIKEDDELRETFEQYQGRHITIKIDGDATYVFKITADGIVYQKNHQEIQKSDPSNSEGIYLRASLNVARRIMNSGSVGPFDLPSIQFKNIDMADVTRIILRMADARKDDEKNKKN